MDTSKTNTDTIAAISTPPGRGGIGIVRLSGPESASIAVQLVRLRHPLEHARTRFADVLDSEDSGVDASRIDEALVTWFAAPHSYTAEDLVEIAAHGSPVVLELLLRRALDLGARLAEPGEFTQRAFLAGRLDLTQAEAVRDLIDAQTLTQARVAASQMGGALSRRVGPVKQSLVELIARLEAGIDFAEDDVDVTPQADIARFIGELTPPLTALEASFARGRIVHDGLTLAIVGRPNAGKSSLFNCLVERERAIVTATPGTTRDTVSERISLDGIPLELVDTAGLREGREEAEQLGIARSREALADAALVLVVLDATQPLNEEEHRLLEAVEGRPALVAVNKSDLAAADPLAHQIAGIPALPTSALTGEGIPALRERILALATGGASAEPGMLTSLRHQKAVATTLEALADAAQANANSIPHEMILLDLYRALWALDSLTGQTTSDDILNLIFSTFCIGK
ncbi:MAG: tRNA uridine-5-carboxymethylaminomethyl(34) synthesis GTPase MnmE [Terracidiphilus sp.]|nr:tRNA uridine-5-carboxymethylaminomethyl(34) synthesis GTPase MnmE [Terracidiphilus sp.]MDR3775440.1 tRNA uridine-5-carboxymethylaminomethyl(34) synthesis GTPase MnmE [Terracidiphilus sp.]